MGTPGAPVRDCRLDLGNDLRARAVRAVVVLCVGLGCQGCSYLFMDKVPARHEKMHPMRVDCTSSDAAPITDVVLGSLWGVSALGAVSIARDAESSPYTDSGAYERIALFYAGLAVLEIASAVSGFSYADECEEAKVQAVERWDRDRHRREARQLRMIVNPPNPGGCSVDTQCKGDRVCDAGRCVSPAEPALRATEPTPVPAAPPPPDTTPPPAQPPQPAAQ